MSIRNELLEKILAALQSGGQLSPDQVAAIDSILSLTDGQVGKVISGEFVYAGATVDGDNKWTFDSSIEVPQASLNLADTLSISEATIDIFINDKVNDDQHIFPIAVVNNQGAGPPFLGALNAQTTNIIQGDDSTLITTNPLLFTRTATFDNQIDTFIVRADSVMTNVRITIRDINSGIVLKYLPTKTAVVRNKDDQDNVINPGFNFIAGDNEININSEDAGSPGIFNVGFTPLRVQEGADYTILIEADNVDLLGDVSETPYLVNKLQEVINRNLAFVDDVSNVADDYIRINDEYTTPVAVTAGIVANFLPTGTGDTGFNFLRSDDTPGGTSATCETIGSGTFSQGDLIQISVGSNFNHFMFEVEDHTGNLLEIRGTDGTPAVEFWSQIDFSFDTEEATITKINVSVIRSGTSGDWEVGKGSESGILFSRLVAGPISSAAQFSASTDTAILGFKSIYSCTDTTADRSLTISSADIAKGSLTDYWVFTVIDESLGAGTNNITIDTEGAELIGGEPSLTISVDGGGVTLASNGSNLFVRSST